LIKEDKKSAEVIKPFLAGRDVKRYQSPNSKSYLILFPKGFTNEKGNKPKSPFSWLKEKYPAITNHLEQFQVKGKKRFDQGDYWWELRACDYYKEFEKPKIIIPAIVKSASYTLDTSGFYSNDKTSIISLDDKYLLAVLNSKACDYYLRSIAATKQNGYFEYKPMYVEQLPIPESSSATKSDLTKLVDQILELYKQKAEAKVPGVIEQIENQIAYTDNKINHLVYQLYDLTEEEIKIVEAL
jgi:hypothetical protein